MGPCESVNSVIQIWEKNALEVISGGLSDGVQDAI